MLKKKITVILALLMCFNIIAANAAGVEVMYLTDTKLVEELFLGEVKRASGASEVSAALYRYEDFITPDTAVLDEVKSEIPVFERMAGRDFDSIAEFENVLKTEVNSELSLPSVMLRMEKGGANIDTLTSGDIIFHINSGNIEGTKTAIIAIYKGERLYKLGRTEVSPQNAGQVPLTGFEIDNANNFNIKIFLWDSISGLRPSLFSLVSNEIYISNGGSDVNPGTSAKPLKSLERAIKVVEELSPGMSEDITVNINSGKYFVKSTLKLSEKSSGANGNKVIFKGVGATKPVISGGVEITGWSQYNDKLYVADVEGVSTIRSMYVNGFPAQRARSRYMYQSIDQFKAKDSKFFEDGVVIDKTNSPEISDAEDAELMWPIVWAHHITPVSYMKEDERTKTFVMNQPYYGSQKVAGVTGSVGVTDQIAYMSGKPFYIENSFNLLDDVGEFYFDKKASKVYYYPYSDEDMSEAEVIVPVTEGLVEISGTAENPVKGISFENIKFMHGAFNSYDDKVIQSYQADCLIDSVEYVRRHIPAQFEVNFAEDIEITNCEFACMSANALKFNDSVKNSSVESSLFRDIGTTAITVGNGFQGDEQEKICEYITIKDNLITRAACENYCGLGIQTYYTNGAEIVNNHIKDLPYTGISCGWGWGADIAGCKNNVISNNRIENVMQFMHDGAAFYTLSPLHGTTVTGNYFCGDSGNASGAIYFDQGTANITLRDNVTEGYDPWLFAWHYTARDIKFETHYTDCDNYVKDANNDVALSNIRNTSSNATYAKKADSLKSKSGTITEFSGYELPEGRAVFYDLLPKDVYQGDDGSISKDDIYDSFSSDTTKTYSMYLSKAGEYYLDVITRCNAQAEDFYITVWDNNELICDRLDIKRVSARSDIRQNVCKKTFSKGLHLIKIKFTTNGSSGFTLSKIRFEKTEDIIRDAGYDEGIIK